MNRYGCAILLLCVVISSGVRAFSQTSTFPPETPNSNAGDMTAGSNQQTASVPVWNSGQPKVVFRNGWLSVSATNTTLQAVLDAISRETGTHIEGTVADFTRITVQLGPDQPLEVLRKLLYGTRFNYIIVGSSAVSSDYKVILMERTNSPLPVVAAKPEPAPVVKEQSAPPEESVLISKVDAGSDSDAENPADDHKDKEKNQENNKDKNKDTLADNKSEKGSATKETIVADGGAAKTDNADENAGLSADAGMAERLANLPEGINPAIAGLYPSLFGAPSTDAATTSGGNTPVSNSSSPVLPQSNTAVPNVRIPLPTNGAGIPILPSNIPPEMWGLYPPNLMQLIQNGGTGQRVTQPTTPLIPGGTVGQGGFWDQSLSGKH
jgi:hypothetical protein